MPRYLQGIDRFHLDARSTKTSPVWRSTLVTPASARSPITSQLGQRCLATGRGSQGDDRSLPALPGAVHFRLRLTLASCLQKPSGRVSSSVRKGSVFSWSAKTSSSYWMESCCQQKTAVLTQSWMRQLLSHWTNCASNPRVQFIHFVFFQTTKCLTPNNNVNCWLCRWPVLCAANLRSPLSSDADVVH